MLAHNSMMLAIVAVCLAVIHFAFDERHRRWLRRWFASLRAIESLPCGEGDYRADDTPRKESGDPP